MRSTIDKILSGLCLLLALVLIVGGGLALWGSSFAKGQVADQLGQQDITMPTDETGLAELEAADRDALLPFAGQKMTTGDQARAYADHFIGAHLRASSQGRTFSEIGNEVEEVCPARGSDETPSDECTQLRGLQNTLFQGNALRGMLLNAYAFGTMGKLAGWAGWAAIAAGVVSAILGLLGLNHAKKARTEEERTARVVPAERTVVTDTTTDGAHRA